MNLNLKNAKNSAPKDGEYTPITPGRYDFVIEEATQKTSQNGNEMLEVTLKVTGPTFVNRKLWHSLSLLEAAQIYLVRFMEAAGISELTEKDNITVEEIATALVGQTVNGFVDIKTGTSGTPRNKVDNFKPVSAVAPAITPTAPAPAPAAQPAVSARGKLFK